MYSIVIIKFSVWFIIVEFELFTPNLSLSFLGWLGQSGWLYFLPCKLSGFRPSWFHLSLLVWLVGMHALRHGHSGCHEKSRGGLGPCHTPRLGSPNYDIIITSCSFRFSGVHSWVEVHWGSQGVSLSGSNLHIVIPATLCLRLIHTCTPLIDTSISGLY